MMDDRLRRHHRQIVVNCYDYFELFFPYCGLFDLTEGKYDGDPTVPYDVAQERQATYLLDEAHVGEGSRVLDVGCGYGRVLEEARTRGAVGTGITLSPPQHRWCTDNHLDVHVLDYRDIDESWNGSFDAIIANGSMEHFVSPGDAVAGHADAIYRNFFHLCHRLLAPQSSGRVVTTTIHFGDDPVDARLVRRPPFALRWGSPAFHCALIARAFGGYYPRDHQLQRCASPFFALEREEDGTSDYYYTSESGLARVRGAAWRARSGVVLWGRLGRHFLRHPVHALTMYACVMAVESWNWQFRGSPPPMRLLRQTWAYQPLAVGSA